MIKQLTVTLKTTTSTLLYAEMGDIVCNSASAITITLPTPSNGLWYRISNVGAGTVIVNYSSVLTTLNQTEQCLCLANGTTDWFYSKGGSSQSITKAAVESVLTGEISTHTHAQIHELPIGGTVGQVLSKIDGANYNVQWVDASGNTYVLTKEGVEGVLTGEITSHTHPVEDEIPIGGTTGQVLAKVDVTDGNVTWVDNTKVKVDGNTVMSGDVTFKAGNNITLSQDNTTKTITISSTGGSSGAGYTTASITIPTTGWIADTGDYAYKNNIAITGVLSTDVVIVSIDKDSHDVASATQMCPTVDSYDGGVTFYVNTIPTADILASCTIISQSSTTPSTTTYANSIDVPPTSPSAWDDEFNGTTLDSSWQWLYQNTSTASIVDGQLKLCLQDTSGCSISGVVKTCPSGNFTIVAKLNNMIKRSGYPRIGVLVAESLTGKAIIPAIEYNSGLLATLNYDLFSSPTSRTTYSNNTTSNTTAQCNYLKVRVYCVDTTWYAEISLSLSGFYWWTATTMTLGFTPAFIGLGQKTEGGTGINDLYFDWFRVTEG